MATESGSPTSAVPLRVTAADYVGAGGVIKWWYSWTGSTTAMPSGFGVQDNPLVFPAGTTTIDLLASFTNGDTMAITQPATNVGQIVATPAIPANAVGYDPGTQVTFEFIPAAGSATPYVNAWTGATVITGEPNKATYVSTASAVAHVVSATYTATVPASQRAIVVTIPSGATNSIITVAKQQ